MKKIFLVVCTVSLLSCSKQQAQDAEPVFNLKNIKTQDTITHKNNVLLFKYVANTENVPTIVGCTMKFGARGFDVSSLKNVTVIIKNNVSILYIENFKNNNDLLYVDCNIKQTTQHAVDTVLIIGDVPTGIHGDLFGSLEFGFNRQGSSQVLSSGVVASNFVYIK